LGLSQHEILTIARHFSADSSDKNGAGRIQRLVQDKLRKNVNIKNNINLQIFH
jgi:hypothetical protein